MPNKKGGIMGKIIVSFVVSVVVDQDEEKENGVDLDRKLTAMLQEMENIGAREFEVFDTTLDKEDF